MYTPDYCGALHSIVTLLSAVLSYHQWDVVHYGYLGQGNRYVQDLWKLALLITI
jgi:hypothetical protein